MGAQLPSSSSGPHSLPGCSRSGELTRRRSAHLPGSLAPGSHSPPKARVLLVASRSTAGSVIVASRSPASHRGPLLPICSLLTTLGLCLPLLHLPPPSGCPLSTAAILPSLLLAEATRPCRLLSPPESQAPPVPHCKEEKERKKKKTRPRRFLDTGRKMRPLSWSLSRWTREGFPESQGHVGERLEVWLLPRIHEALDSFLSTP